MIGMKVMCGRYSDSNAGEMAIAEVVSEPFVIDNFGYVYVVFDGNLYFHCRAVMNLKRVS